MLSFVKKWKVSYDTESLGPFFLQGIEEEGENGKKIFKSFLLMKLKKHFITLVKKLRKNSFFLFSQEKIKVKKRKSIFPKYL